MQGGAGWCRAVQGSAGLCRVVQGCADSLQSCAGLCKVVQNSTSHMCKHNFRIDLGALIVKLMPRLKRLGKLDCMSIVRNLGGKATQ